MNKTICIFAAYFYPHLGGIERYNHQLALQLINLGYKVIIVTSNTENSFPEETFEGIEIYRYPVKLFLNDRLPVPLLNRAFIKILKKVINVKSDYYIINARFYFHSLLGALIAKGQKKPSLVIEHGTGHFILNNRFLYSLGHLYEHTLTKILKILVKNYFGVSLACNEWLKHFKINADGVFYNGIDTSYQVKNRLPIKQKYDLPDDSIIITYIGRLIPEKGVLFLKNAFDQLTPEFHNIYLFIAGNGPLFEELSTINKDSYRTILLGYIGYDEVMNLLIDTDLFVLPSNYPEGLPTSILEAGFSHCAVISTAKGGTLEVITDESLGIIITPESEKEIIQSLHMLIVNHNFRDEMKENLFNKVNTEFDWSIIAGQVSDQLQVLKQ